MGTGDPLIDQWMTDNFGRPPPVDGVSTAWNMVNMLLPIGENGNLPIPPEEVMVRVLRLLRGEWRKVAQGEIGFAELARRSGWPEERIHAALQIDSSRSVQDHLSHLRHELIRTHPGQSPEPDR